MPIYEYKCPTHGISEQLVKDWKHSEESLCRVDDCYLPVWKVMSSGSFRIQGVYPAMERKSDIRLRERNQALKNTP